MSRAGPSSSDWGAVLAASGPFKFLDYFTEEDATCFDGRRRAIQNVVAGVLQSRTFVLYGASGSGKTSLIRAGLFPALRDRGYLPVYARTLADPLADLVQAVRSAAPDEAGSDDDLRQILERLAERRPVVLVLDQLEELFTRFRGTPEERLAFAEALGELSADRRLELRLVFSLRQDYVVELEDFREVFPDLFEHEYRLKSLTAFGARQAIASQLRHAAMPYEPRFLVAAVDLLEGAGFDPTILQIVCSEVYRRAAVRNAEEIRLTAADLQGIGTLELMFAGYLEDLANDLDPASRLTARAVLDALITREGTKQALTFDAIAGAGFRAQPEELEAILSALVLCRLVRRERRGGERWYELVHERLVPVLEDWLKLDPEYFDFRLARSLIANSVRGEAWRRNPEALLAPGQIRNVVRPYRDRLALAAVEREFLLRSAVHRRIGDDAVYWARQMGDEGQASELLAELLADDEATIRRGAAAAVRWFPAPALTGRCARLAIDDPDPEVRREAADSLAAAEPSRQEIAEVTTALADRETREAAAEALVSLRLARRRLPPLGLWRPRIVWLALQRVTREQPEVLRRAAVAGARRGSRAAVLWVPIAVAGVFLLDWSAGGRLLGADTPAWFWLWALLGVALPTAFGFGLFVGARLAVSLAQSRLLHQKRSWFRLVALSRSLLLLALAALVLALLLWRKFQLGLGAASFTSFLGILGAALLASAVLASAVAGLVHLNGLALLGTRSRGRVWLWALITSCGLPLLLPFLAAMIPWWIRPAGFWWWTRWLHTAALPLGFLCFVLTLSLARPRRSDDGGKAAQPGPREALGPGFLRRTARRRPALLPAVIRRAAKRALRRAAADRSERWRLVSRGLAVASIALGAIGFLVAFGIDTLPFLAATYDLETDRGRPIEGRLGPGYPDADYLRLDTGSNPLTVVRLAVPDQPPAKWELGVVGRPPTGRGPADGVLLLPAGKTKLTVVPDHRPGVASTVRHRYRFYPQPQRLHDPGVPGRLDPDRWSFTACELGRESAERGAGDAGAQDSDAGTVSCTLRGRLTAGRRAPGAGVEVALYARHPNRAVGRDFDARVRLWRITGEATVIGEATVTFTGRAAIQTVSGARNSRKIIPLDEQGGWEGMIEVLGGAHRAVGLSLVAGLRLAPVGGDTTDESAAATAEAPPKPAATPIAAPDRAAPPPPTPPPDAAPAATTATPIPDAGAADSEAPIWVIGDVVPPRRVSGRSPKYLAAARRRGIRGQVLLLLTIDRQGAVTDVDVLQGLPLGLTGEATRAVRAWRYEPATRDGRPVEVYWKVGLTFGS